MKSGLIRSAVSVHTIACELGALLRTLAILALLMLCAGSARAAKCPYGEDPHGNCLDAPIQHGEIKRAPQQIVVESEPPGAEVKINTESKGITGAPLILRLPAGSAIFEFSLAGYARKTYQVRIAANGRQVVSAHLTPLKKVEIKTNVGCILRMTSEATQPPTRGRGGEAAVELSQPAISSEHQIPKSGFSYDFEAGRVYKLSCSAKAFTPSREVVYAVDQTDPPPPITLNLVADPVQIVLKSDQDTPVYAVRVDDNEECPDGRTADSARSILGSQVIQAVSAHETRVQLSAGIGWYCFVVKAELGPIPHFASLREVVPSDKYVVHLKWFDPMYVSWLNETSFELDFKSCLDPAANGAQCLAASAWLARREAGLDVAQLKRLSVIAEGILSDLSISASPAAFGFLSACEQKSARACEAAAAYPENRTPMGKACALGLPSACLRVRANVQVAAVDLFSYEPVPPPPDSIPWWRFDKKDRIALEFFWAGNVPHYSDLSVFMIGGGLAVSPRFGNFGLSARILAPTMIAYQERDLIEDRVRRRYAVGLELVQAEGRVFIGPYFLAAGAASELLYDSGVQRAYSRLSGFSLAAGIQLHGWGLRGGVRLIELQDKRATVNEELLHGSGARFLPYIALETNFKLFNLGDESTPEPAAPEEAAAPPPEPPPPPPPSEESTPQGSTEGSRLPSP
ncbi:MAG: PEGA domain-containing protein [Polyangiaceae bacterium]